MLPLADVSRKHSGKFPPFHSCSQAGRQGVGSGEGETLTVVVIYCSLSCLFSHNTFTAAAAVSHRVAKCPKRAFMKKLALC